MENFVSYWVCVQNFFQFFWHFKLIFSFVSIKIRQTLPAAFKTSTNWPNSTCNCLSLNPGDPPQYESGEIKYALKKTIKPPIEIAFNQVTVALKSIKRLKAHDESNGICMPLMKIFKFRFTPIKRLESHR